jgi:hypothetical protein
MNEIKNPTTGDAEYSRRRPPIELTIKKIII